MRKKEKRYAKKSISKNGICILNCFNYCSRLCILQPLCGKWTNTDEHYKVIFAKDIKARANEPHIERPKDETEAIADIFRRMDEIQNNLEHERRQRKKLAVQTDELTEGLAHERRQRKKLEK